VGRRPGAGGRGHTIPTPRDPAFLDRRYVVGDPHGDPGYKSTAKMLGESALCLAYDELASSGGVQTPSVSMDGKLVARLRRAGLVFQPK
jgi:saccharopine dehydrogenase (NAD+, L-glutamate forming)